MNQSDVCIVGAGVVGLSLALALPDTLRISILADTVPQSRDLDELSSRVVALNHASIAFLRKIGVWSHLTRPTEYVGMQVWDSGGGEVQLNCQDIAAEYLGYIVDVQDLINALLKRLSDVNNISIQHEQLKSLEHLEQVMLNGKQQHTANCVIGADGAQSWVRQQANVPIKTWSYQQTAITCVVETQHPHEHIARQCFMPSGPCGILPLSKPNHHAIIWSCDDEKFKQLMNVSDETFCDELSQFAKLGSVLNCSKRFSFPLVMQHAKRYDFPHGVLVGDAAHTIHPLAGLGLNLGLADAATLSDLMSNAKNWSSAKVLRRYARERKAKNTQVTIAMDGFKQLFSRDNAVLKTLRHVGMDFVNRNQWLKSLIIEQANQVAR